MINAWLYKRKLLHIERELEIARLREQAACTHKWTYIGAVSDWIYNGHDADMHTQHLAYCPYCDKREYYEDKEGVRQAVKMAELREAVK